MDCDDLVDVLAQNCGTNSDSQSVDVSGLADEQDDHRSLIEMARTVLMGQGRRWSSKPEVWIEDPSRLALKVRDLGVRLGSPIYLQVHLRLCLP